MKTIDFEIIFAKNPQISQRGYVEVPADEEEDVEWFYYNQSGMPQPRMFTHHDEIGISQIGATDEQEEELDEFLSQVQFEYVDFVDNIILLSEEDENRTYKKGDIIIKINDGAKMECEIKEDIPYRGDFVVEVIPRFNGEFIPLAKYMCKNGVDFDPWLCQDDTTVIEDGHIYFEMSKDYWDGDAQDKADRLYDVNQEAKEIFAMYLTYELGIYPKYGEVMEQSIECNADDEELFKLSQFVNSSDDELDAFLRAEGYIDEELEN